jgi:predicted nucleic acid-binding protein
MLLLDTSILIRVRDRPSEIDDRLVGVATAPSMSIVTRVELEGGAAGRTELAVRRRALLDELLRQFPVLDFDADCAAAYRDIIRRTEFSRRKTLDRMIAATALVHGLTLITANGSDFADIPELSLQVWDGA